MRTTPTRLGTVCEAGYLALLKRGAFQHVPSTFRQDHNGRKPTPSENVMSTQELEAQVLRLARHERARLAQKLIASLDEEGEIEQAWAEEAERRYEELRDGSLEALPAQQVFAEVRSKQSPT